MCLIKSFDNLKMGNDHFAENDFVENKSWSLHQNSLNSYYLWILERSLCRITYGVFNLICHWSFLKVNHVFDEVIFDEVIIRLSTCHSAKWPPPRPPCLSKYMIWLIADATVETNRDRDVSISRDQLLKPVETFLTCRDKLFQMSTLRFTIKILTKIKI